MGQFYLDITQNKGFGGKVVQALEIIAEPKNHPLVFNCAIGKDRTGILAAMLLSSLGVAEKDIIEDYSLSDQYMAELRRALESHSDIPDDVKVLPDFFWRAEPESMALLLTALRKEYGSAIDYLAFMGAEKSLAKRLGKSSTRLVKNYLHQINIQQFAEFIPHFPHHPDVLKAQRFG